MYFHLVQQLFIVLCVLNKERTLRVCSSPHPVYKPESHFRLVIIHYLKSKRRLCYPVLTRVFLLDSLPIEQYLRYLVHSALIGIQICTLWSSIIGRMDTITSRAEHGMQTFSSGFSLYCKGIPFIRNSS